MTPSESSHPLADFWRLPPEASVSRALAAKVLHKSVSWMERKACQPASAFDFRAAHMISERIENARNQFRLAIGDIESAVKDAATAAADLEAVGEEIPSGLFNRLRGIQSLLAPLLHGEGSLADID